MGLRARARRRAGTRSTQRHLGADRARRSIAHGGVDRPDRGRRALRGVPGGRRRGRARPSTRSGRSTAEPGRPASRSASGWASTRARPTSPATTTAASTSTARPGSPPSGTAARSSCPRRRTPRRRRAARRAPRLRDLGRHVLKDVPRAERLSQLDIAGLPTDFPPLRTVVGAARQPARSADVVRRSRPRTSPSSSRSLEDARLVTLTGPGGIGKTSLAIEAARALAPRVPGRGLVRRTSPRIDDPEQVTGDDRARDRALRRPGAAGGIGAVLSFLADRSMILVLDNMEHLLAAADEVAAVVHASPASRVLVTSRAPLHIAGEQELPVAPLVDDAVGLFIDRARAVRPGWEPGDDGRGRRRDLRPARRPAARHRARRGSRVGSCSPTVIRDRLAARLPLPGQRATRRAGAPADARRRGRLEPRPPRRPIARTLLHRLGVFEGGFDLEQVDAVAGPSAAGGDRLDDLLELADQSLIVAAPTPRGRARFRMLRTIQSFALDRLAADGIEADVRRRHAEAFLALATQASRPAQHVAPRRMARSHGAGAAPTSGRPCAGRSTPARATSPCVWRPRLWRFWQAFGQVAEGRQLAEAGAGDARGSDERIGPRVGAGRGRQPRLLAGRLGDGAPPLRGSDRRRRGGRRRGMRRRCVLQLRPRRVRCEATTRRSSWPTSTRSRRAIATLGDERGAARAAWGRGHPRAHEARAMLGRRRPTIAHCDEPRRASNGSTTASITR